MIPLPVCRWRREPTVPGRHACVSPKLIVGTAGVLDDKCSTCYCRDHPPALVQAPICRHLGKRLAVEACPTCPSRPLGAVRVGIHHCHLHGSCTIEIPMAGRQLCKTCPDRSSAEDVQTIGAVRHLMYFVCPLGSMWRWNLQQLRRRISLFNGRRLVFVVQGDGLAPLHHVQKELEGCGVEWMTAPNNVALREYVGFPPLLRALSRYNGESDVTFYGHAKGVSSAAWGAGVRRWAEAMYSGLLDYWPAVRHELRRFQCVGVFRKHHGWYPVSTSRWHYAGSFRWVRNREMYARKWDEYIVDWVCPEDHVARVFDLNESSCLFADLGSSNTQLYGLEAWPWVEGEIASWEANHMADYHTPLLLTVVLASHQKPRYVHDAIRSVVEQTSQEWRLVVIDSGDLIAAGEFKRYATDGRILCVASGEADGRADGRCKQGWVHNLALSTGLVTGDLVLFLSDDDLLYPRAVERFLQAARHNPGQSAWYGPADVQDVAEDCSVRRLDRLGTAGVGSAENPLCGRVDGMQVCCRLSVCPPWPEDRSVAAIADGVWIDALGEKTPIHPLALVVGVHRHTPVSTFTRSAP